MSAPASPPAPGAAGPRRPGCRSTRSTRSMAPGMPWRATLRAALRSACRPRVVHLRWQGVVSCAAGGRAAGVEEEAPATDAAHPTFMVWGANTGVGKTLVSAGLAAAAFRDKVPCTIVSLIAK